MNVDKFLQDIQDNINAINKQRSKDELLKLITQTLQEPVAQIEKISTVIRSGDGSRKPIELITQNYTLEEIEQLPVGTVVLQLDSKMDKLIITPYIVSMDTNTNDKDLINFYKSKHIDHMPIVEATTNSIFVVLYVADKKKSLKENVLLAKQKLDTLVSTLSLTFAGGSYIAEIPTEVQPSIIKDDRLGIGSTLYEDILLEAIEMPIGTVFMSETNENILYADVVIKYSDTEFMTLNATGKTRLVKLDTDVLLSLGLFVIVVDMISQERVITLHKNTKDAKLYYRDCSDKYSSLLNSQLRKNPKRPKKSAYVQFMAKLKNR